LRQNPEIDLARHKIAVFVVKKLRAFGVDEIYSGIGRLRDFCVFNGHDRGAR